MKSKHIGHFQLFTVLPLSLFLMGTELRSRINLFNRLRRRRSQGHEGDAGVSAAA